MTDASYYREVRLRSGGSGSGGGDGALSVIARSSSGDGSGSGSRKQGISPSSYHSQQQQLQHNNRNNLYVSNVTVQQPIEAIKALARLDVPVLLGECGIFIFHLMPIENLQRSNEIAFQQQTGGLKYALYLHPFFTHILL